MLTAVPAATSKAISSSASERGQLSAASGLAIRQPFSAPRTHVSVTYTSSLANCHDPLSDILGRCDAPSVMSSSAHQTCGGAVLIHFMKTGSTNGCQARSKPMAQGIAIGQPQT